MASERPDDIPHDLLQELAASGAICPNCGGLEITSISAAIIAIQKKRETGIAWGWCACGGCPVCGEFRKELAAFKATMDAKAAMRSRTPTDHG